MIILRGGFIIIKIEKNKTQFGYDFKIFTNEGTFIILFGGNLDLYWNCLYDESMLEGGQEKYFYITKENYYLFSLIDNLYNNIKNYEVISVDDVGFCCDSFKDRYDEYILFKEDLKRSNEFNNNWPFVNDGIEWYSDDVYIDIASVLRIEKCDEAYKIIFRKGKSEFFETYSVRFRNIGSRYDPYNFLFMKMYNDLCLYDTNFHQIHVEEYLYSKKLVKDKK